MQLEEKRKETKGLEDRVSQYEGRERDYAQTLLCVNRLWEQLNADLQHMCTVVLAGSEIAEEDGLQQVSYVIRDPFLRRLIMADPRAAKAVQDKQKHLESEQTQAETALRERSSNTQALLATLLATVQQLKAGQDKMANELASCSGDEVVRKEMSRVTAEASSLKQQLDTLRALQRPAEEQLKLAEDRQLELEERIKKLQNELADTEQELSNVQRKLFTVKNSSGAAGLGPAPALVGLPAGAGPSTVGGRGGGGAGVAGLPDDHSAEELADLKQLLNKRTADLEKEKEMHMKMQRYVVGG